MSLISFKLKSK